MPSMTAMRTLSAAEARRFLVRRHLLAPPRRLPGRADSVLAVVARLGSLQFDPLDAPGARNHELVLHARIRGYRRGWCERWLYGRERRLFEAYNKGLSILPLDELPYHRIAWERGRERHERAVLARHAAEVARVLEDIRRRGPQSTAAVSRALGGAIDWWWGRTALGRALLEALFVCGRLGIARREGNARSYDLIERLFPAELLARRVGGDEANRHRLLTRVRAVGLLGDAGSAEVFHGTVAAAERRRLLGQLVAAGVLVPVAVEGVRGTRYLLAEEEPLLEGRSRALARVTLLAPLDPLLWDRRLVAALWGFEYRWEVYTPAARRRYGYYVLPLLHGDRLVGRIEPRRADGALVIAGLWLERDVRRSRELERALDEALEAYRAFVGAERVVWRTRAWR